MVAIFLVVAFLAFGGAPRAHAAGGASVVESVVHEADISGVVDLIQQALIDHRGLSLDDNAVIYGAIGRTNQAIDRLYNTGATGDVFNTAEDLLLTQLDLLHEVEAATLSQDIGDLNTVVVGLVDVAQRRLAFERQMGNPFTLLGAAHPANVVDIARDDAATRIAMASVISALVTGQPVDLDISDVVYRALGETSRGLDLVDETGETGDVFDAAVNLLEHRFQFLADLEQAVISGDLDDLRAVADSWVNLSQEQLIFERQLVARESDRAGRSFLQRRGASFLGRRSSLGSSRTSAHDTRIGRASTGTQIYTVQAGDTLNTIADRFNTTVDNIAQVNNIAQPNLISTGMQLVIPVASAR
jgi:hypothetical protein